MDTVPSVSYTHLDVYKRQVLGNLMDDVRFYGELSLVREGIEKIHEALPGFKYVPMKDAREKNINV